MARIESDIDTSSNQLYYCKIYIDDIEVIPENILTLDIREWTTGIVPRLELNLNDDGLFSEIFSLDDSITITVEIAKNADDDPIEFDFMLQDHSFVLLGENQSSVLQMTALLNVPELFTMKNRSFANKSSKDVLEIIANECGLTFNIPTGFSTSDNMTWLQVNQTNQEFITHVMERAYKANDTVFCYCDIYKNLNMTSLKLELNKTPLNARYDITNYTKDSFDNTEDTNTIWFNYYEYTNLSGYYNKTNNYGNSYNYYDLEDEINEEVSSDTSLLAEKTLKKESLVGTIVKYWNFVLQNNVFDNYTKAIVQNEYLKKNFMAFAMTLNINPLSQVKLFDVLNVAIPSMPNYAENEINDVLSGKYAIGACVYSVGRNNIFQKQLVIFRDGKDESKYTKKKSSNK